MIIYCIHANRGGLTRVAEAMIHLLPKIPSKIDFKLVILSKEKFHSNDKRFIWLKLTDDFNLSSTQITEVQSAIEDTIDLRQVKWIIGEEMTLPFWDKWNLPIVYDVHLLQRPLFEEINKSKDILSFDKTLNLYTVAMLKGDMLRMLKQEAIWLRKAQRFIVNSKNSFDYLNSHYSFESKDKKIYHIPVSTQLELPDLNMENSFVEKIPLYYFGRFHPQKGLHFLFNEKWLDYPISMRGIRPSLLTPEVLTKTEERGIFIHPWNFSHKVLAEGLSSAQNVIFPSLYEPWGLSLQESLALGKFCIAHKHSGHSEQIIHKENGWLINMHEPNWKEQLIEAIQLKSEDRQRIQKNAKESSCFGHNQRDQQFIRMLEDLSV
jgi:glycosyltransferase involved in cell wall biosynthesis